MERLTLQQVQELKADYEALKELYPSDSDEIALMRHEVQTRINPLAHIYINGDRTGLENISEQKLYREAYEIMETIKKNQGNATSIFKLEDVLNEVISQMQVPNERLEKTLDIEKLYDSHSTLVKANKQNVKLTLENLFYNAARYSENNNIVSVNVESDNDYVKASVIDYGTNSALNVMPTPEESKAFVFAKGKSGGKGHGDAMYVFKKSMNKFGGDLMLEYAFPLGKFGSKFSVILPKVYE